MVDALAGAVQGSQAQAGSHAKSVPFAIPTSVLLFYDSSLQLIDS